MNLKCGMAQLRLSTKDRQQLKTMTRKGTYSARVLNRARILLLSDRNKSDTEISESLQLGRTTVYRIKKRYQRKGLSFALEENPRPGQPKKYSEHDKAEIIALVCSTPPTGAQRWSLRLLTEEAAKVSKRKPRRESVRLILKKVGRSLG